MTLKLDDSELANNPNPRLLICFVFDVSGSISGHKIDEINKGLKGLLDTILENQITRYSSDIAILTFGGTVKKILDFGDIENIKISNVSAGGLTPMGEAVLKALDMLEDREKQYGENAVYYWKPWLFIMSDGAATDDIEIAAKKTCNLIKNNKLDLYSIPILPGTPDELNKFCGTTISLKELKFEKFFEWLSQSIAGKSESTPGTEYKLPSPSSWSTTDW